MLYLREYRAKAERLFDHLPWVALIAAAARAPVTGFPTWPALSRGRPSCTPAVSALVGWTAFVLVRRLAVAGGA